jgi:hypothetical protein
MADARWETGEGWCRREREGEGRREKGEVEGRRRDVRRG